MDSHDGSPVDGENLISGSQVLTNPDSMPPSMQAWWIYKGDIPPSSISDWDCTEGSGVAVWARSDQARVESFAKHDCADEPARA